MFLLMMMFLLLALVIEEYRIGDQVDENDSRFECGRDDSSSARVAASQQDMQVGGGFERVEGSGRYFSLLAAQHDGFVGG